MADIVWIASYPKSGNTWLRILLANYLRGGKADINALESAGQAGGFSRAVFDRHCGVKSTLLTDDAVTRLRPAVYRAVAGAAAATLFLKIHDGWQVTGAGEALFPADVTRGVLYVVRNVLDVAPSAAHHWGLSLEDTVARLCDEEYVVAVSGGVLAGLPQRHGSWSGHVRSWCDRSGLPLHVIRYEDLAGDTPKAFAAALRFLGEEPDPVRLANAVEHAGFNALQARERDAGFREHSSFARGRFFRRGQVGAWCDEMPAHLVRRLIAAHGDTMQCFGYIDGAGNPAGQA